MAVAAAQGRPLLEIGRFAAKGPVSSSPETRCTTAGLKDAFGPAASTRSFRNSTPKSRAGRLWATTRRASPRPYWTSSARDAMLSLHRRHERGP